MVTKQFLLEGAAYALEHCGVLLRDAVALYDRGAFSSAIVLALFGREELGKYVLLENAFKRVDAGETVDSKTLLADCRNHQAKQTKALLSIAMRYPTDGPLGQAASVLMRSHPSSADFQEAQRVLEEARVKTASEAPAARHQTRMRALYVEPMADGSGWMRPQEQAAGDAKQEVWDVANDYSLVYDHLVRGNADPSAFLSAFQAWHNRPSIPEPVWPNGI